MKLIYPAGATPLDEDEREQLIPSINTQGELNDYEKANISDGLTWARKSRKIKKELTTISGLILLHRKMFEQVWLWAGQLRRSEKNIGVAPHQIQIQLQDLCSNTNYWIEHQTFSLEEIAVRFHHQLVFIHAFPNGNGRHSRIATDLLLQNHKSNSFTWGNRELINENEIRAQYILSLKEADKGNYDKLLRFVKT